MKRQMPGALATCLGFLAASLVPPTALTTADAVARNASSVAPEAWPRMALPIVVWHSQSVGRRRTFLAALWAAFGVFWVFAAAKTAINPILEPAHGPPVILILQIALAAL